MELEKNPLAKVKMKPSNQFLQLIETLGGSIELGLRGFS